MVEGGHGVRSDRIGANPKPCKMHREMADIIIDQTDQEWLLGFGIDLLGRADI